MAAKIVRNGVIYAGSNKIAECSASDFEHNNGMERQFATDGVYFSEGQDTVNISITNVIPVAGTEYDLDAHVRNKEELTLGRTVNGKFEKSSGFLTTRRHAGNAQAGTEEGTYTFIGAKPEVV